VQLTSPEGEVLPDNLVIYKLLKKKPKIKYLILNRVARYIVKWNGRTLEVNIDIDKEPVAKLVEFCIKEKFLDSEVAGWKVKMELSPEKYSVIIPHRLIIAEVINKHKVKVFFFIENKI